MDLSPPAALAKPQHYGTSGRNSVHTHYFQPPKSPVSAAATPATATGQNYFSTSVRKRQRPDSAHSRDGQHTQGTPWAETPAWSHSPGDRIFGSGYGQNSELVNERYRLADGFDTPGLESSSRLEQLTVPEDEFRRRLRGEDDDMDFAVRSGCPAPFSGPLARERNGVARVRPASDDRSQTTWTSLAINFIGKAFTFGSTVVRGFYAGGGKGYDMQNSALVGSDLLQHTQEAVGTPIPGSWHDAEADFLGDFEQDSPYFNHGSPSRPAVKRRQTDRETWVLVPSDLEGRPPSPKRKISGNGIPRSTLAPSRPSASRASSRRSLAPVSRRTTSHYQTYAAPVQASTPNQPQNRRASTALTRSPQSRPASAGGVTLVSPEAERFARRQAKQDKTMMSMSNRIQEMMRQAQEALGTKYAVEGSNDAMDAEDDGFIDDE
ncbi:hypothetical protein CKM354_000717500 [Cercospora kikuchii]|uniref:Uncharacterized protein n=1 Tax=Cercospora kikuchii TaxID=84275 RepID=A0A9P3FE18_9PEZI|nr:uncharacterized protein CKM354_000717500 [Cercospora kikuchii]GIZ43966.1 hypothetical protein CKM354_000717500 [Cercospora kikuchii]